MNNSVLGWSMSTFAMRIRLNCYVPMSRAMSAFHVGLGVDPLTLCSLTEEAVSSAKRNNTSITFILCISRLALLFDNHDAWRTCNLVSGIVWPHHQKCRSYEKKCEANLFGDENSCSKSPRGIWRHNLMLVAQLFRLWCHYLQLFRNIVQSASKRGYTH